MIFTHCRVCRCCVEASGFLCIFFVRPWLNKIIKKVVCIFSMQRPGVILPFRKKHLEGDLGGGEAHARWQGPKTK
jgi:hypothetical protein